MRLIADCRLGKSSVVLSLLLGRVGQVSQTSTVFGRIRDTVASSARPVMLGVKYGL